MKRPLDALLAAVLALGLAPALTDARSAPDVVYIADGVTAVSYDDKLRGSEARDYMFPAHKDQRMTVILSSDHGDVQFRIRSVAGDDTLYDSARNGPHASGVRIRETGTYRIRVYLKDAPPDRGRRYSLQMRLS